MIGARRRPDWVRAPAEFYVYPGGSSWGAWLPVELAPDPDGNPRGRLALWIPPWAVELRAMVEQRALDDSPWYRVIHYALSEPDMAVACALVDDFLVAYQVGGVDAVWRRVHEVEETRGAQASVALRATRTGPRL